MSGAIEFSDLHPVVILGYFASVIAIAMCVFHPVFIVFSFAASLLCMLLIEREKALKTLGAELILFILISLINQLFTANGSTVIFNFFDRPFTLEALVYGMCAAGTFCAALQWLVCFGALFTEEKFISLFSVLSPTLTLLLSMVLKLMPELREKLNRIKEDRRRIGGIDAESVTDKVGVSTEILSVTIGWAMESGADTAASMKARGYGCGKRTSFTGYRFHTKDFLLLAFILIADALIIPFLIMGKASAVFYPSIILTPVSKITLAVYATLLFLPTIIYVSESLKWHISISKI